MSPIQIRDEDLNVFENKTVIITGGASGIGLAAGKLFSSLHAHVVLADRNEPHGESIKILQSDRVKFVKCDVTDWGSLTRMFEIAKSTTGRIDVVCANAGINDLEDIFNGLETDKNGQLLAPKLTTSRVVLDGVIYTVCLAFHHMVANGGGSIVMTSSMAGYLGLPEMPIYAAAKHGIVGLLRSLKAKSASKNTAISLVAPGMTPTPILGTMPTVTLREDYGEKDLERLYDNIRQAGIPANRTETVAKAVVFLAASGLRVNGYGLLVSGDEVWELEESIVASWPQWLLDATDFIRNAPTDKIFEPPVDA